MDVLLWILAVALLCMALWVGVVNWSVVLIYWFTRKSVGSWTPLLSGVCGAVGVWLLPVEGASRLAWVPLFLDWGSVPGLLYSAGYYVVYLRQKRS